MRRSKGRREEIREKSEQLRYAAAGGMILIVPHSGTPKFFTLHFYLFTYKNSAVHRTALLIYSSPFRNRSIISAVRLMSFSRLGISSRESHTPSHSSLWSRVMSGSPSSSQ